MTNDLISREALQYIYSKECHGECQFCNHARYTGADGKREYGCALINDAPAVDAAPVVHGRWESASAWAGIPTWMCNKCHTGFGRKWKYCPNCGARMDKEE